MIPYSIATHPITKYAAPPRYNEGARPAPGAKYMSDNQYWAQNISTLADRLSQQIPMMASIGISPSVIHALQNAQDSLQEAVDQMNMLG